MRTLSVYCTALIVMMLIASWCMVYAQSGNDLPAVEKETEAGEIKEQINEGGKPEKEGTGTEQERKETEIKQSESEKVDKKTTQKIDLSVIHKDSREYIALFVGYGGFFPVADYGGQYKPANMVTGTVGIYAVNFLGLSPELHVRYAAMGSRKDPLRYGSDISLVQFFPAIVYRYHFQLPRNTLTVYGRIWDGLAHLNYSSRNQLVPFVKEKITENINTFGLSAGCYYDVWKGLLVGIDFTYGIVFTAGKPLQSVTFAVNVGWRIL